MANHLGGGSLINKGAKHLVVTELYKLVACEVFHLRSIFSINIFLQWQPRGYFRVAFCSFVYTMNWHIDFHLTRVFMKIFSVSFRALQDRLLSP
jgi:hypothetical protein